MLSFLTDRERSRSSIKVGVVFVGRTGVCVPAMHAVFSCSSQPWSVGLYLFSSRSISYFSWLKKYAKGPGTGLVSRMKLCSWVLRHHSVASFFPLLSLRSKFGNGVTRFSRINNYKTFPRSNIPRSISSFLANNNYDSQQCRFSFLNYSC